MITTPNGCSESKWGEPSLDNQPDSAKMASPGANQGPVGPSIGMEPGERLETGENRPVRPAASGRAEAESSSAADTMGMSVALEGDARQAAAVKLAEEQALVRKAHSGDRLAFEDLVRRYDRDVLRLALNLVHRPEDARDIYQESFLRVYRNLHRFRFECSFYTWLYRIVTNVALDHLRRRTSHREDQAPVPDEAEGGMRDFFDRQPELSAAANPEKRLLGQELGAFLGRLLTILAVLRGVGDILDGEIQELLLGLDEVHNPLPRQFRNPRAGHQKTAIAFLVGFGNGVGLLGGGVKQALLHLDQSLHPVADHIGHGAGSRGKRHDFLHSIHYERGFISGQIQHDLACAGEIRDTCIGDLGDDLARVHAG